jgi:lysozyme
MAAPEHRWQLRQRRWLVITAGVVILGAALAMAWWFLWVPNWRPPLREGERYGIDVSEHQGSIDWQRVATDDIDFVYVKATEGGDFVDGRFVANWNGATAVGIDRGACHFFTLCTPGATQARNFLTVVSPSASALAPILDLELAGNCRARPDPAVVAREVDEFVRVVEAEWGRSVVLYIGADFEGRYPTRRRAERPLWHRRFLFRPDVDGWIIWQVHGHARVRGISGEVDLNIARSAD